MLKVPIIPAFILQKFFNPNYYPYDDKSHWWQYHQSVIHVSDVV